MCIHNDKRYIHDDNRRTHKVGRETIQFINSNSVADIGCSRNMDSRQQRNGMAAGSKVIDRAGNIYTILLHVSFT